MRWDGSEYRGATRERGVRVARGDAGRREGVGSRGTARTRTTTNMATMAQIAARREMAPVWVPPRCAERAHPRVLAGTRRAGSMMGVLSSPDPSVEAIFRAGGLAGPTNAPGARETSRSRRRKRDAKLRATVSPARGGATTRAGVLAPSRSARAGTLTSSECSRRTFPRQKYSTWANSLV